MMTNDFFPVEQYLRDVVNYSQRSEETENHIEEALKRIKAKAINQNDQQSAKKAWCYEKIQTVQRNYLSAFSKMKEGLYYDAWYFLERLEIDLNSLAVHFTATEDDSFKLNNIEKHVRQFQSLYPYKLFISPAFLYLEKTCSICENIISIRNPCGHRKGEIYNGEMCVHKVTKLDMLEISVVTNPVQKYSVLFMCDSETGEQVDHYDYTLVKYAIDGLRQPFDAWDVRWTKIRHPHSLFTHVDRDDDCPCDSGKKYGECCLQEDGVLRPHVEFIFHVQPPDDISRIIIYPDYKKTEQ